MRKPKFCIGENKGADTVTVKLLGLRLRVSLWTQKIMAVIGTHEHVNFKSLII